MAASSVAGNVQTVGKALLGGPWCLVDTEGRLVSNEDLVYVAAVTTLCDPSSSRVVVSALLRPLLLVLLSPQWSVHVGVLWLHVLSGYLPK